MCAVQGNVVMRCMERPHSSILFPAITFLAAHLFRPQLANWASPVVEDSTVPSLPRHRPPSLRLTFVLLLAS